MIKAQEHQQFDKKYKSKVDSLLYVDQMFRKINRNKLKETIKVVDSLNVISMLNILNTEGLPSEKKIGFDYQPLNAIFMHNANYSLEINNRFDFSEYLYKGIYNGELDSRIVAHNIEGMSSISYGFFGSGLVRYALCLSEATDGYCKKMEYSKKGFGKLSDDTIQKINTNRLEIGLEKIEDMRRKMLFQLKNHDFKLQSVTGGVRTFVFSDRESYLKGIENLIVD